MGLSEACGQREGEGMLGEGRWERDPKLSSWTSSAAEPRELGKPTGASLVPRDATGRDKASPCAFFGPQASPLAPQGAGVGGHSLWASETALPRPCAEGLFWLPRCGLAACGRSSHLKSSPQMCFQ